MITGRFSAIDATFVRAIRTLGHRHVRLDVIPVETTLDPVVRLRDVRYALGQLRSIDRCLERADESVVASVDCTRELPKTVLVAFEPIPDDDPLPAGCSLDELLATPSGPCVLVTGCFDLIHPGHMRLIELAAGFGARPVIAALTTRAIRSQPKNVGRQRPVWTMTDRYTVLSELRSDPRICFFDGPNCLSLIDRLRPDVYVKEGRDRGRPIVEEEARLVEKLGGRVEWVDVGEFGMSSTAIIERLESQTRRQELAHEDRRSD